MKGNSPNDATGQPLSLSTKTNPKSRIRLRSTTLFERSEQRYGMIATSYLENVAAVQMRMMPTEEPSSEIVCLVDDDPLVLRSTGVLVGTSRLPDSSHGYSEYFIIYVASH